MGKKKTIELSENQLDSIKSEILECKSNMEDNILTIGNLLLKVKSALGHGYFGEWLENEVEFTQRSANRFMKTATEFSNSPTLSNLGKSKMFALLDIKKYDREDFINATYEIDGEEKTVQEMSVRELNQVIKEYKQANKKTKKDDQEDIQTPTDLIIQEDISDIWEDTISLNKELHMRVGSDEDLETTLIARYNANEITHQQLIDVVAKEKLNLPIFFYKDSLEEYLDRKDYYSDYEHYGDKKYYSLFVKEFEWQEAIKCYDEKEEDSIDWSNNNHVGNNLYQLSEAYDDNGYVHLCIYRDYRLQGAFLDGDLDNIKALCNYDNNLDYEQLKVLYEQLEQQIKGYKERNIIREAKEQQGREKKYKEQEKYREVQENWKTNYQVWAFGKWTFESIWDKNGNVYDYKAWNDMSTFVNEQRTKAYKDTWSNMLGGSNSLVIYNEEEKNVAIKMKRLLFRNFHPDVFKDGNGQEIDLINKIFKNIE